MNFPDALFPQAWALGAFVPLAFAWARAVGTAPWGRLAAPGQLNLWLGTIVLLVPVWSMQAGVKPGLNLHLLGAMMFTLMFGRPLAILGLSIVLACVTLNQHLLGHPAWQAFGLNALVLAVFPVLVADAVRRAVEAWLPPHFFVFVFVSAFGGAALTLFATGLAASGLMWSAGAYTLPALTEDYLPFCLLLAFAEAWLNGALITLMVVYLPHWVGSFDDRRYLLQK